MSNLPTFISLATIAAVLTSFTPSPRAEAPLDRYMKVTIVTVPAVKDTVTGLTWMRNELDGIYTWDNAKLACGAVGTGWRLPSVVELSAIVDELRATGPLIDVSFFEGRTPSSTPSATTLWTSVPYALVAGEAWVVAFRDGPVYHSTIGSSYGARCVR